MAGEVAEWREIKSNREEKEDGGYISKVQYEREEDGERYLKIVTTTYEAKKRKEHPAVEGRKNLPKFGKVQGLEAGPEEGITVRGEEIDFQLMRRSEKQREDAIINEELKAKSMVKAETWKSTARRLGGDSSWDNISGKAGEGEGQGSRGNSYLAPHLRKGGFRADNENTPTIRVSNIPDNTSENDLRHLFGAFGKITRLFLARDKETRALRGFAFIHYTTRSEAEAAIEKLHGHCYGRLLLQVEWAKPRVEY